MIPSSSCRQRQTRGRAQGVRFQGTTPPAATAVHPLLKDNKLGPLLDKVFDYDSESDSEPTVLVTSPDTLDVITLDSDTEHEKELFRIYTKAMLYHLLTFALVSFLAFYVADANRADVSGLCLRFPSLRGCEAERKSLLEDPSYVDLNREITALVNDSSIVRELVETNQRCSQNQNILIYSILALVIITVVSCCICCLKAYLAINKCLKDKECGSPPARRSRW